MKHLLIAVGLIWVAVPASAMCGEFTMCNSAFDYYVPENLMRLSDQAEADRQDAFWRKLHCRDTSDDMFGRVTCDVNGKEIVWEDERQDFYKPEPLIIFVPEDGAAQYENLTSIFNTGNIVPERKTDAKSKHEID